jgi:hypothetical protein
VAEVCKQLCDELSGEKAATAAAAARRFECFRREKHPTKFLFFICSDFQKKTFLG